MNRSCIFADVRSLLLSKDVYNYIMNQKEGHWFQNVNNFIFKNMDFLKFIINTRPISPSLTKHIRHITNKVTAD